MSSKPFLLTAVFLLAICLLASSPVNAHRVNLFAWVESGQVHVKASFSRKNPARESTVIVLDGKSQAEILRGQTDENGIFVFTMPSPGPANGLLIRVNAGEGHQNEWQLKAEECAAGVVSVGLALTGKASTAGSGERLTLDQAASAQTETPVNGASVDSGQATGQLTASNASLTEIRAIIDTALESKLGPIREAIAQQAEQGPRLQDIIGGLGWIMGLVGIGLAVRNRKV